MHVRIVLTDDQQEAIRKVTGRSVEIASVVVNFFDGTPEAPFLSEEISSEEISLPMEDFSSGSVIG
jgi:hypothetical protein